MAGSSGLRPRLRDGWVGPLLDEVICTPIIHLSTHCLLELDPVNISPLPASIMLSAGSAAKAPEEEGASLPEPGVLYLDSSACSGQ